MDAALRIASLAVIGAILCVLVREREKSMALVLSLAACGLVLCLAFRFFMPILETVERLRELSGLNSSATAPLLKTVGIGLLTQLAVGVCEDAGEKSLAGAAQIGGTVMALYAALPLVTAVLELLEDMLGG